MKKGDFSNKNKMYALIIVPQWVLTGMFFIYYLAAGRSITALFVVENPVLASQMDGLKRMGMGVLSALAFIVLIFLVAKKLKQKFSTFFSDQLDSVRFMLPTTVGERLLFALVALTAGFCEEVIFRAVMLDYFQDLPWHLSITAIIIIMSVFFGIVHLYQGVKGVIGTAYIGAGLLFIFLITGNLWICILLHFLIDVKFVFTRNSKKETIVTA